MGGVKPWPREWVVALEDLAARGYSASQIARAIPVSSRNAVIGKAARKGIKLFGGRKAVMPPSPDIKRVGRRFRKSSPDPLPEAGAIAPPRVREDGSVVTILDARYGECRFPLGKAKDVVHRLCGLPAVRGRSWCAGHMGVVFKALPAKDKSGTASP